MFRAVRLFTILGALALTHCAPSGYESATHESTQFKTGGETADGRKFTVGAETRLPDEVIKITPQIPAKETPEEKRKIAFHESLKQFRFLRYDQGGQKPARLGTYSYRLEVKIQEQGTAAQVISFHGQLSKNGSTISFKDVSSSDKEYAIAGDLNQLENAIEGKFVLSKTQNGKVEDEATVLYRAYEAELEVATPNDKNIAEHVNLAKKIENLKSHTKAWVNDFVVPLGSSTFDAAIVKQAEQVAEKESWENVLMFTGRSVETDSDVSKAAETAQIFSEFRDQDLESIELVGNAEGEDSKIFALKMKDDKGEATEIMISVERQKTEKEKREEEERARKILEEETKITTEIPQETPVTPLPDVIQETKKNEPVKQEPKKKDPAPISPPEKKDAEIFTAPDIEDVPTPGKKPEQQAQPLKEVKREESSPSGNSPGNNSKSYMSVSTGANALKIVKDFDRNITLAGVQKEIRALRNGSTQLRGFFKFANPFRGLIENIAKVYTIPPQYAYVSLIESAYFYGGKYEIQVAKAKNRSGEYTSTATGPFQILFGTGQALGMRVVSHSKGQMPGASDERRYFVPSACAAAKYFRNNAKMFPQDATLAILAYNQGEGRAGSLARQYGFSFAKISRNNVSGVSYSNKKLAAYFVAGNYEGSRYDVDSESPKNLPRTTLVPPNAIKDAQCRQVMAIN